MTDAGVVVKDVNVALLRKHATGERLHNVGLATSGACATALPPAASLARATSWAVSSLGSATWTLPTWRARRSAVARPTPEPPPVTTATLAMPIGVVAHVFLNFFGSMGHLRCWPIGALTPHDTNPTYVRDIPWFGFCQDPCLKGPETPQPGLTSRNSLSEAHPPWPCPSSTVSSGASSRPFVSTG
jgi:hypothetical protein